MNKAVTSVLFLLVSGAQARDRWATIFTHGGGTHPMYFSLSDAFRMVDDNVIGSVYARTTRLLREDPYFWQTQPQQGIGLKKASGDIAFDPHNGAHLFGIIYDAVNTAVGGPKIDIYSYGWTGLLSIKARRSAGRIFYQKVEDLVNQIRLEGDIPHIRIIAYSHGGNMCLHMAEELDVRSKQTFVIDELVLVATPVHPNTAAYLSSPLFKKVYLFYSIGDNIQASDFLSSPTHSFAQHTFSQLKNVPIPSDITQVQVRVLRKEITVIKKDGSREVIQRRDMIQPNHTEMFFFGWAPEWYRKHFPLKPLSVAMFIPYFMRIIDEHKLNGQQVRFTLIPDEGRTIALNKKTKQSFDVPFFDKKTFYGFRQQLWQYRPDNVGEYRKRMKAHWDTAKEAVREERKAKHDAEFARRETKREEKAEAFQARKQTRIKPAV